MVWLCIPSARPVAEVNARMSKWKKQGYKIALWRDPESNPPEADYIWTGTYPGYAKASNFLIETVFRVDPSCDWVVCGGDDVDPDLSKTADQIAFECEMYFGNLFATTKMHTDKDREYLRSGKALTFGCLQPVGDRWGENEPGARQRWPDAPAMIDRICGSPWIGREFARRVNQGHGPWWPEYFHMHVDEELFNVAKGLGVLWQRRDLIHFHNHWGRKENGAHIEDIPPHLKYVSGPEHWKESSELFARRKAAGFPGSAPL